MDVMDVARDLETRQLDEYGPSIVLQGFGLALDGLGEWTHLLHRYSSALQAVRAECEYKCQQHAAQTCEVRFQWVACDVLCTVVCQCCL